MPSRNLGIKTTWSKSLWNSKVPRQRCTCVLCVPCALSSQKMSLATVSVDCWSVDSSRKICLRIVETFQEDLEKMHRLLVTSISITYRVIVIFVYILHYTALLFSIISILNCWYTSCPLAADMTHAQSPKRRSYADTSARAKMKTCRRKTSFRDTWNSKSSTCSHIMFL